MAEPPTKPPHDRCEGQPDKWELEIVVSAMSDEELRASLAELDQKKAALAEARETTLR